MSRSTSANPPASKKAAAAALKNQNQEEQALAQPLQADSNNNDSSAKRRDRDGKLVDDGKLVVTNKAATATADAAPAPATPLPASALLEGVDVTLIGVASNGHLVFVGSPGSKYATGADVQKPGNKKDISPMKMFGEGRSSSSSSSDSDIAALNSVLANNIPVPAKQDAASELLKRLPPSMVKKLMSGATSGAAVSAGNRGVQHRDFAVATKHVASKDGLPAKITVIVVAFLKAERRLICVEVTPGKDGNVVLGVIIPAEAFVNEIDFKSGAVLEFDAERATFIGSPFNMWAARARAAASSYDELVGSSTLTVDDFAAALAAFAPVGDGGIDHGLVFWVGNATEFAVKSAQIVESQFGRSVWLTIIEPKSGHPVTLFVEPKNVPELDVASVTISRAVIFRKDGTSRVPVYQMRLFGRLSSIMGRRAAASPARTAARALPFGTPL